jgi:hypothetical protein
MSPLENSHPPKHTALPQYRAIEQPAPAWLAALLNNWAEVARLETVAREQVAALQPLLGPKTQSREERLARLAAFKAILRHDAQVRALADPGWFKVQPWLE